ncbi:MAG: deoxyribose-phosphate aldolase [Dethiobacter sp.]|jgi:deoxyribose-phosphate aldolase|nr:deoxyribose-phosphate aldolase [Dethiobacter sp.]
MTEKLASYIDHTILKPEATREEILKLCAEAVKYEFAAVCINPCYVKTAAKALAGTAVKVCTVIGFPLGATTAAVKAYEAAEAVATGAGELDMVLNIGALKSRDEGAVLKDIAAVVKAARDGVVKVILEAPLLTEEEKIIACRLAKKAGAHYVKSSTGFGPGGATAGDIRLMRETVGPAMGVKAAGGVRTKQAALEMIAAGATRIGTSNGVSIIGA